MKRLPDDIFNTEADIESVKQYIEGQGFDYTYLDQKDISNLIRPRDPAAHKGTFGHALLIAGSEGKTGASVLACKAALRSGCGLVTALVPASAEIPLLCTLPEAMMIVRQDDQAGSVIDLSKFQAIGFGPGVGMKADNMLFHLLKETLQPVVIDADGLTLLSINPAWYQLLGSNKILTPHGGEFDRLTKNHKSAFERFKTQLQFSKTYQVNVLLKGRHTSITTPSGKVFFNITGNSGMATAGSGDVLTGIITSLLAQGYSAQTAAVLGAYLHGYAGDKAAHTKSKTSMMASDIIDGIPQFFKQFEK